MSDKRQKTYQIGVRLEPEQYARFAKLAESGTFFGYRIPVATLVRKLALEQLELIAKKAKKATAPSGAGEMQEA